MNDDKPPLTKEEFLAGRRFEDLSASERELYGQLHRKSAEESAQRFVDNLNRNVARKRGANDD